MTHSSNWNYTTLKQRGGYDERRKTICDRSDLKVMSMHKELSVKSRVRGDFHARFCERVRVKLPRSTRPCTALRILMDSLGNTLTKSTSFSNVSNPQINKSKYKINIRPREKLNFSIPRECFYEKITYICS